MGLLSKKRQRKKRKKTRIKYPESIKKGLPVEVRIQRVDQAIFKFYDQLDRQKLLQLNLFDDTKFLTDGHLIKLRLFILGVL
jgi:hypothetical protein